MSLLFRTMQYAMERKRTQLSLKENEALFRSTFEQAAVGIAHIGVDHTWLRANQFLCALLGYQLSELFGQPLSSLFHADERQELLGFFQQLQEQEESSFRRECRYIHKQGTVHWAQLTVSLVRAAPASPAYFVLVFADITQRKQLEMQLQRRAMFDVLTGLPNRALLMDRLQKAIQRHKRSNDYLFAVLFLDLDGFKGVNDTLGHLAGDQLLIQLAKRLEFTLRSNDTVARLGGDEFAILLDSISSLEHVEKVSERIQALFDSPFELEGREVFINTSTGIVLCSDKHGTAEELLRDADTAMYQAKSKGKARFIVFDHLMREQVVREHELENALRRGLNEDEFAVFFQPIWQLPSNRLCCFEALVRWQHLTLGLVPPSEFLMMAEETGLLIELDMMVLRKASAQWCAWGDQVDGLGLQVNLSAKSFLRPDLPEKLQILLQETGLSPNRLTLEITEGSMLRDDAFARDQSDRLMGVGISLALDDFGTGYSSLRLLRLANLHFVKIDSSFVRELDDDKGLGIIEKLVDLCHSLGLKVTAEGIENSEEYEKMIRVGCDFGQGYHFSRPLPPEAALVYIKEYYRADS